jgi:hypothetical protein
MTIKSSLSPARRSQQPSAAQRPEPAETHASPRPPRRRQSRLLTSERGLIRAPRVPAPMTGLPVNEAARSAVPLAPSNPRKPSVGTQLTLLPRNEVVRVSRVPVDATGPALLPFGRASRTAGIPAGAFDFLSSSVVDHRHGFLPLAQPHPRKPSVFCPWFGIPTAPPAAQASASKSGLPINEAARNAAPFAPFHPRKVSLRRELLPLQKQTRHPLSPVPLAQLHSRKHLPCGSASLSVHLASRLLRLLPQLAADSIPLTPEILIANARLEFRLTHSKQSPLKRTLPAAAGNRKQIAFSQPKFFPPLDSESGRAFRTAGLSRGTRGIPARSLRPGYFSGAGAFALSSLITHHSPLITGFLIYCAAIRNPRKPLKT